MTLLPLLLLLAPSAPSSVDVFTSGQDGYHTYRIPAVVRTAKGTLLAFCEGRRKGRGDSGDIDLLVKRSSDGGRTWSAATTVADFGGDTIGNPAPVLDRRTGTMWLLLTRNPGDIPESRIAPGISGPTRTVWVTRSTDDGETWAPPADITAAVKPAEWAWYATGPGNGIQLRSGRLVIPCDHYRTEEAYYSHVIYSDDAGKSWKLGGSAGPGCNESAVVELADGSLMLNMRSYRATNRRMVSISRDAGLTWNEPAADRTLIEPVCQGTMIRYGKPGKRLVLFANPAATKRVTMTVRLSRDDGKTWSAGRSLHAGPAAYSNLIDLGRGWVGLLYERGESNPYERITFTRMPFKWLEE